MIDVGGFKKMGGYCWGVGGVDSVRWINIRVCMCERSLGIVHP